MLESIKDTSGFVFKLNTKKRILIIQKSELKNINRIISKITKKTTLSMTDIADYDFKIIE